MKKFNVYNVDEHFSYKCVEEFNTIEEAECAKENIMDNLYDDFIDEVINEAKNSLIDQLNKAIVIEEVEIDYIKTNGLNGDAALRGFQNDNGVLVIETNGNLFIEGEEGFSETWSALKYYTKEATNEKI